MSEGIAGQKPGETISPTYMTLRTYIAAKAMQGILAGDPKNEVTSFRLSQWSVECADALIAELSKPAPPQKPPQHQGEMI